MELEMRSVEPGDMKSVIVDEMSIRWSAIRSSAERRQQNNKGDASAMLDRVGADCKNKFYFSVSLCGRMSKWVMGLIILLLVFTWNAAAFENNNKKKTLRM